MTLSETNCRFRIYSVLSVWARQMLSYKSISNYLRCFWNKPSIQLHMMILAGVATWVQWTLIGWNFPKTSNFDIDSKNEVEMMKSASLYLFKNQITPDILFSLVVHVVCCVVDYLTDTRHETRHVANMSAKTETT